MIRVSAPLRLPIGGGGTDLPSCYRRRGGFLVAAALRDSVRVTLRAGDAAVRPADPWIAEALRHLGAPGGVQVEVESDAPGGSGLGGSGALLVALAHALRLWRGERPWPRLLAEEAFAVERGRMGRPVGRQDPYVAAYGGVLALRIGTDGRAAVRRLRPGRGWTRALERSLLLVDTGRRRDAARPLAAQERCAQRRAGAAADLDALRSLGRRAARLVESARPSGLGGLFRLHWDLKRRLSPRASTAEAERILDLARAEGARGGKLIGAGGGGFVLLDCGAARRRVEGALAAAGLAVRPVRLEPRGSRVLAAPRRGRRRAA